MPKLKKGVGMGTYLATDEEAKAMRECIDQRIVKISPKAKNQGNGNNEWYIDIWLNGKWNTSTETWGPGEIWEQIYTYYQYYYDKYGK